MPKKTPETEAKRQERVDFVKNHGSMNDCDLSKALKSNGLYSSKSELIDIRIAIHGLRIEASKL